MHACVCRVCVRTRTRAHMCLLCVSMCACMCMACMSKCADVCVCVCVCVFARDFTAGAPDLTEKFFKADQSVPASTRLYTLINRPPLSATARTIAPHEVVCGSQAEEAERAEQYHAPHGALLGLVTRCYQLMNCVLGFSNGTAQ